VTALAPSPYIHDYTEETYGHDVVFRPRPGGLEGFMHGQGDGVEVGHIIRYPIGQHIAHFRVHRIQYLDHLEGLWHAYVAREC
jgi:hypothetical protein